MKSSRNVLPSKLDIAIAASVVFLVMMTLSYYRAIDLDEGFYVIAVKLTAKQQIPYLDYFFNQAPFMPVVYGIWLDIFGSSWISLRLLSVLMGVSSGLIIFSYIYAETRSRLAAATALALYASCGYVLTWLTVVKPYSLATLFLVSAFATLCWPPVQPGRLRLTLSGLLCGLGAASRIYVGVVVPIFALWVLASARPNKSRVSRMVFLWLRGRFQSLHRSLSLLA